MSDAPRQQLAELPPSEISEDPDRFQSRAAYPRDWMDQDLDDVELYNSDLTGFISVWRLEASTDEDAFARGVELNLAQWVFERGDKLRWAIESRRAAVDRALHTRWLAPDSESANRLYKFYPELERRYSSFPEDHKEAEIT